MLCIYTYFMLSLSHTHQMTLLGLGTYPRIETQLGPKTDDNFIIWDWMWMDPTQTQPVAILTRNLFAMWVNLTHPA